MTDRWTQVNFPTLSKHPRRRLQRHNTTADLPRSSPVSPSHSLPSVMAPQQLRVMSSRPRSLHLSGETFHQSKSNQNVPEGSEIEETPPYSSNSSIVTSGGYTFGRKNVSGRVLQQQKHYFLAPVPPYPTCGCFDDPASKPEPGNDKSKARMPSVTPEGLSWRRLHMSRAKLKATSTTSELLSGFAMVAMVELQINEDTAVPEWLFVMFSVCTTVLVAVHIFALMISTYILPNIDAISKLDVCELVTESPHERMKGFIELAWAFSTVLGLFLFLVEVAILCWVKFWDYSFTAAVAATVIVVPVLIIFVLFAVHFYHSLVVYRCDTSVGDMQRLEDMKRHLDQVVVTTPV